MKIKVTPRTACARRLRIKTCYGGSYTNDCPERVADAGILEARCPVRRMPVAVPLRDLGQRSADRRRAACRLVAGERICVADSRMRKLSVAPDNLKPLRDDAIEAAITRVLEAEAAARSDIARARSEATEIAELARQRARGLAIHTDRRIRMVRAAFAARVTAEVAALEAEADALSVTHDLTPSEVAQVETAVAALARGMAGGPA